MSASRTTCGLVAAACLTVAALAAGGARSAAATAGSIAFLRDDGVYTMRANGSGVRPLLQGIAWRGGGDLVWSPDGRKLAFVNKGSIWVMDADGSDLVPLTPRVPGKFGLFVGSLSPSWSRDGTQIAYSYSGKPNVDRDVWVMDADGGNRHRLAKTPGCSELDVDWAPKSGRLVTTCVFGWGAKDLRVMSVDGARVRTLLASRRPNGTSAPDWSPDGRSIVFVEFEPNATAIAVVKAEGGSPVRLTNMEGGVKADPAWSPDGRRIAFASFAKGRTGIWVMSAVGTSLKRLTAGGRVDRSPTWQPVEAL